jgi:tetratricopeptide (TPR) repeat protein
MGGVPKNGRRTAQLRPPGRRTGWGYERLLLVLAALTAAVTLGVQLSGRFNETPVWLPIVLYSIAAVLVMATVLVRLRSATVQEDVKWAQQVRELLALHPGPDGQLPLLSSLSPYKLGASPSRYGDADHRGSDPYVPREIDKQLDAALREKPFVLVVGDSKAGKSRTAYEAARRFTRDGTWHDPAVLVPKKVAAVEKILNLEPPLNWPKPALLWLDDLTEGELDDLTPDVLDRLANQVIVLGTITALRYERVSDDDSDIGRNTRQILTRSRKVRLDAELTDGELNEAHASYPDEQFKAGIGEQLVGANKLLERYDNARQGAEPHSWAITQAAIDWVRMDVGRPVRQSELAALYPLYLAVVRPTAEPQSDLSAPLEWACKPVGSRLALLQHLSIGGEASYLPFDYLVDIADGQHGRPPQPISDSAWDQLPLLATPEEMLRVGNSAHFRDLLKPAMRLFQAVIDSCDAEYAGKAAYNLGLLRGKQGDISGAQDAYQKAIDSCDAEYAGKAAHNLGRLLHKQGDISGAQDAYQKAIDSGHPDAAGRAANNLGRLLEERGDITGAKATYQKAIDSGHPEYAGKAAYNLGLLRGKQGDISGAQDAYQKAIDSGHPEAAGRAALHLGRLLEEQGDISGAQDAYQKAIDSGHPEIALIARWHLGQLRRKQDDISGAQDAYQKAIDSGHPEVAGGAYNLALLLNLQGDIAGAKAAYQKAIDSGHPDVTGRAAFHLGRLLHKQGDIPAAKAAYQKAIDSGDQTASSQAAGALNDL